MNTPVTYGAPLTVSPLDSQPAVGQGTAIYRQVHGYATPVESPPILAPSPVYTAAPLSSDTTLRPPLTTSFECGFGSRRLGHPVSVV
jgi:hypothetical protein